MEIRCPSCHTLIQKENINEEEGWGFCDTCKDSFLLSDVPDNNELEKQESKLDEAQSLKDILHDSPKGVYIYEESDRITIGVKLRAIPISGIIGLFIAFIILVFTVGFIFGGFLPVIKSIADAGQNIWANPAIYFFIVFTVPVVFVFGGWIITIIMVIMGKMEVVLGKDSWVFTGIDKIGIKKTFDWKHVQRVYKRTWTTSRSRDRRRGIGIYNTHYEIVIQGKTKVNFGKILNDTYKKQFEYILLALQYYHKHRN